MSFKANIEKLTLDNTYYRKVIHTTPNMQLVLMTLKPNQEIGLEAHKDVTQFIRIEEGKGLAYIANKRFHLKNGDVVMVAPNTKHNIINTGTTDLALYTLYSHPIHSKTCKQKHKEDDEC